MVPNRILSIFENIAIDFELGQEKLERAEAAKNDELIGQAQDELQHAITYLLGILSGQLAAYTSFKNNSFGGAIAFVSEISDCVEDALQNNYEIKILAENVSHTIRALLADNKVAEAVTHTPTSTAAH